MVFHRKESPLIIKSEVYSQRITLLYRYLLMLGKGM